MRWRGVLPSGSLVSLVKSCVRFDDRRERLERESIDVASFSQRDQCSSCVCAVVRVRRCLRVVRGVQALCAGTVRVHMRILVGNSQPFPTFIGKAWYTVDM